VDLTFQDPVECYSFQHWTFLSPAGTHTHTHKLLFIIGDWNAKVGSQEISRITSKFSLGVHIEAGQRLTEFCQENMPLIASTPFQQPKRRPYTWTSPDDQF